jgi:arylsulfatase A-like enzyme
LEKLAGDADFVDTYEETEAAVLRELYLGEVSYVDDRLADVFGVLEDRGFLDNTLLIVTADHGEEFREHGGLGHHVHYDEVIHVPLIVKAPTGPLSEAGRYAGTVSLADLAPTVYAYCGVEAPGGLEGVDLASLVGRPEGGRFAYSEGEERSEEPKALRSARYTVIENRDAGRLEVYDRAGDAGEQVNLRRRDAALSEGLINKLRNKYAAVAAKAAAAGDAEVAPLGDAEKSKLEALGYLGD